MRVSLEADIHNDQRIRIFSSEDVEQHFEDDEDDAAFEDDPPSHS